METTTTTTTRTVHIERSMVDDGNYPVTVHVEDDGDVITYAWYSEQFGRSHEISEPSWYPLTDVELADRVRVYERADVAYIEE